MVRNKCVRFDRHVEVQVSYKIFIRKLDRYHFDIIPTKGAKPYQEVLC